MSPLQFEGSGFCTSSVRLRLRKVRSCPDQSSEDKGASKKFSYQKSAVSPSRQTVVEGMLRSSETEYILTVLV